MKLKQIIFLAIFSLQSIASFNSLHENQSQDLSNETITEQHYRFHTNYLQEIPNRKHYDWIIMNQLSLTPLHYARTITEIRDILSYCPDINAQDIKKRTPIDHMIHRKRTEAALCLYQANATITEVQKEQLKAQCKEKNIPFS